MTHPEIKQLKELMKLGREFRSDPRILSPKRNVSLSAGGNIVTTIFARVDRWEVMISVVDGIPFFKMSGLIGRASTDSKYPYTTNLVLDLMASEWALDEDSRNQFENMLRKEISKHFDVEKTNKIMGVRNEDGF